MVGSAVGLLAFSHVNRAPMHRAGNPRARFMHCLPAFHDHHTTVAAAITQRTGMHDGLEVTNEVFRSDASIVFDQAEDRLHTIKAIPVARIGS